MEGWANALAWSPNGRWLAVGGNAAAVWIWDMESPDAPAMRLPVDSGPVDEVAWSPRSDRLAIGCSGAPVRIWSPEGSGSSIEVGEAAHGRVTGLSWSSDGVHLAVASAFGRTEVWDVETTPAQVWPRSNEHPAPGRLAWSPNGGALLAIGTDGVRTWSADGIQHQRHVLSSPRVGDLDWSSDGSIVVLGEGQLVLADPEDSSTQVLRGARNATRVSASPDARYVAATGPAGTLTIWEPASHPDPLVILIDCAEPTTDTGGPSPAATSEAAPGAGTVAPSSATTSQEPATTEATTASTASTTAATTTVDAPSTTTTTSSTTTGPAAAEEDEATVDRSGRLLHDVPADADLLNVEPLAAAVSGLLWGRLDDQSSIAVNVDAAWGRGKSSFLRFLARSNPLGDATSTAPGDQDPEAAAAWDVVSFDAWRHSRVSPTWWALAADLRRAECRRRSRWGRVELRVAEVARRAQRHVGLGATSVAALLLATYLASVSWTAWYSHTTWHRIAADLLGGAPDLATIGAALIAGVYLVQRIGHWDRVGRADPLGTAGHTPMAAVADHFGWLRRQALRTAAGQVPHWWRRRKGEDPDPAAQRRLLFVVEELDRCQPEIVVEVLDSIHTLMRPDKQPEVGAAPGAPNIWARIRTALEGAPAPRSEIPIAFVVLADAAWIRRAYSVVHSRAEIVDPTPLGAQFHSKLFDLAVPLPPVTRGVQASFVAAKLTELRVAARTAIETSGPAPTAPAVDPVQWTDEELAEVRRDPERERHELRDIYRARGLSEPLADSIVADLATEEDLARTRQDLLEQAQDLVSPAAITEQQQHLLARYGHLLPRNPRSVVRVLNDWIILQATQLGLAADEKVSDDELARWAILNQAWPDLTQRLLLIPGLDRPEELTADALASHLRTEGLDGMELLGSWPVRRVWPMVAAPADANRSAVDEGHVRWTIAVAKLAGSYPPLEEAPPRRPAGVQGPSAIIAGPAIPVLAVAASGDRLTAAGPWDGSSTVEVSTDGSTAPRTLPETTTTTIPGATPEPTVP
jgi:hypothetical protein